MSGPCSNRPPEYRKSSYSGTENCVEVAVAANVVRLRDSKRGSHGIALVFTSDEWSAFLSGVRAGEFDLPDGGG